MCDCELHEQTLKLVDDTNNAEAQEGTPKKTLRIQNRINDFSTISN